MLVRGGGRPARLRVVREERPRNMEASSASSSSCASWLKAGAEEAPSLLPANERHLRLLQVWMAVRVGVWE